MFITNFKVILGFKNANFKGKKKQTHPSDPLPAPTNAAFADLIRQKLDVAPKLSTFGSKFCHFGFRQSALAAPWFDTQAYDYGLDIDVKSCKYSTRTLALSKNSMFVVNFRKKVFCRHL